ncbi:hypothetical protein N9B44_00885 [bacterium]|nr:hypothetical protein [bacterium]MDA7923086.1 hypothetical protein [bacterium]
MGLDTVELVMEVEESFGIKIPDDDAQRIVTVGDLFEFVKAHTELAPAGTCLTAATFYDIRNGLRAVGIEKRFGPSTPLAEILPEHKRRSFWATLTRNTRLRLPNLVRPSWVIVANVAITICASIAIAFLASERDLSGVTFFAIAIMCLFTIGFLASLVTTPFATNFATEFVTFRGLSERVLALNATKLKNEHGPMGPNDIWVILRELIVNQVGVDIDEVTPDASFVKDLGCD